MPRTAPTVNATPTYVQISFAFIDHRGDKRSVSLRARATVTTAEVEALADAYAQASNATLYSVRMVNVFAGNKDASIAIDDTYESVSANVAIGFGNITAGAHQTGYIPAPIGNMVLDGDVVDTGSTPYLLVRNGIDACLDVDYAPQSVTFTERRDKNDRIPA